ncbi:MAG: aspartate carbamoyltransferase regulatory subunit [Lachnospiraceae bacterium]|nr:aspartate carbamoyltransferase regulatory subunit [Lachnospiraceae bacterium]MBR4210314.1 aspartate carbamoyltransferase regulatory subunit [Lachnospiraceae bacterium]
MLNVGGMEEGIVLDHIRAGKSLKIYYLLGLDKLDCEVAMIKNAHSNKMGRKDILKIEGGLDRVNLDVLGYLDHKITVNIIKNNQIVEKKKLSMPKKITNVIFCKNPRCITSIEQELPHVFYLADEKTKTYRCMYCDEKYKKN